MIDKTFWLQVKEGWSFFKDIEIKPVDLQKELPPQETIDELMDEELL